MKNLLKKLLAVQKEAHEIEKTGRNEHFKYDFVEESAVLEQFKELFNKHSLVWTVSVEDERVDQNAKGGIMTTLKTLITIYDVDSGESLASRFVGQGYDSTDKGSNKAITSAVKYFLLKNFLCVTGEKTDVSHDNSGASPSTGESYSSTPQPAISGVYKYNWPYKHPNMEEGKLVAKQNRGKWDPPSKAWVFQRPVPRLVELFGPGCLISAPKDTQPPQGGDFAGYPDASVAPQNLLDDDLPPF